MTKLDDYFDELTVSLSPAPCSGDWRGGFMQRQRLSVCRQRRHLACIRHRASLLQWSGLIVSLSTRGA